MEQSEKNLAKALRKANATYTRKGNYIVSVETYLVEDIEDVDTIVDILLKLKRLRELTIGENVRLREEHCHALSSLKTIRKLRLASNKNLHPARFEMLLSNLFLSSLDITIECKVEDFLAIIGQHVSLKELSLEGSLGVFDEHLALLSPLENLESLDLSFTRILGWGLASLHTRKLRELRLHGTDLVDEHVASISQWKHSLRILDLSYTFVTSSGLEFLFSFSQLSTLCLSGCNCRGSSLNFLQNMSNLRRLDITHTAVDGKILSVLSGLKGLAELGIISCRLTPDEARKLQEALPECDISYST